MKMNKKLRESLKEAGMIWRIFKKNPLHVFGLVIILSFIFIAVFAPFLAPYPEQGEGTEYNVSKRFQKPSWEHLCGTDWLGRDLLSRVIMGSRVSLRAGLLIVFLSVIIGTPIGAVAGYYGGKLDEILMRITDIFLSFPPLLLAIAIAAVLGPSVENAIIAIAVSWWTWYTRIERAVTLSLKEEGFIEAAKALGISDFKIITRHIIPNSLAPIMVQATMDTGSAILTMASLSFIGLGATPPTPEWGLIVSKGRIYVLQFWWISLFPSIAIFLVVLGFNLVGDGLREALDPRLRRVR